MTPSEQIEAFVAEVRAAPGFVAGATAAHVAHLNRTAAVLEIVCGGVRLRLLRLGARPPAR